MTSYPVNLDLLRAMHCFTSADKSRPALGNVLVAFDPDQGETSRVMFAATNSYVLAVGTGHATDQTYIPAAIVAEFGILAARATALVPRDTLDMVHKLTPKPAGARQGFEQTVRLEVEQDGRGEWIARMSAGGWVGEWSESMAYPNVSALLTGEPEAVQDVTHQPEVLSALLKAVKALDAPGVTLHGGAEGVNAGIAGRQFWSIRSGDVGLVGVAMPIRGAGKWLGES